MSHKLKVNFVS